MPKHDYSGRNVADISQSIADCENMVESACLSTESMPYSWDTDIVHTVVTWMEVLQVNSAKDAFRKLFSRACKNFETISLKIDKTDQSASARINAAEADLNTITEGLDILNEYLEETMPVPHF